MKIALDGIFLNNLNCGTGQYCYHLVKGLNLIDPENEYFIISPFENQLDFKLGANFKWLKISAPNLGKYLNKVLWEQFFLPLSLKKISADVFHSPYMALPYWKTAGKYLVTIHDVIGFKFKEYRRQLKWKFYYWLIKKPLEKAETIITVSEFSKQEILGVLKIDPAKIKVIYGTTDLVNSPEEIEKVRKKYNLTGKLILAVGSPDPRKNLAGLLKAFNLSGLGDFCDLVIVNEDKNKDGGHVKFLGRVAKEELALLYQAAEFLVYPSLYEGFGLPVLEAMGYGCPVIAANTSSVPEIVGSAGLLVSAYFPESIAEAMKKLFNDGQLRRVLVQKGRAQAQNFGWLKMASETKNFYF